MNLRNLSFTIFLIAFFSVVEIYSQISQNNFLVTDTIRINFDNKYFISQVSIIPNTETVKIKERVLQSGEYQFFYDQGFFKLSDTVSYSIFDTIVVSYLAYDLGLKREYKRRSLVIKFDEQSGDTLQVVKNESNPFSPENIFGSGIQKSGTIVRGFTVGTTKDFSLNSGLRLQLSGKLSDDIEIVAALTDENTPIQPEGNTERLEELDKVFIQVKHSNAIGTFGDYQLRQRFGVFGIVDRKLQGLMGEFIYENTNAFISIASSRGKFNTNNFNGQDGVQGPYRLNGINNERDIIIIAGTEKVFLDGIEMRRGENNDYTIEYSNATITFTPNRLITSASRISVDFEYTDRQFSRNFFGAGISTSFFDNKLKFGFEYLREGDNQDAPIDITLTERDKEILSQAGDDRNKAVKSGVRIAEPDSLGIIRGIYSKVDTLVNGNIFSYYIYNPGDSLSVYNVSFSYVGEGKGDYVRESLGVYRFVGIGRGGYLPIIFIPIPQLKQLGAFTLSANILTNLEINFDYAGSLFDKNRFSSLDENDNFGYAANLSLNLKPSLIEIGKINLGKAGISYRERFVEKKFTSFDRFNDVEFNRYYNTSTASEKENESLREIALTLIPIEQLRINSTAGFLSKGDSFSSKRFNNLINLSDNKSYFAEYNLDYVNTSNQIINSKWFRHRANAYYQFWNLKPGIEFLAEDKNDKRSGKDSLLNGSLKYLEFIPFIELSDFEGLNFITRHSFREDYFPINGIMLKESVSKTNSFEINYKGFREFTSSLNLTIRNKNYTKEFKQLGLLDNQSILVRSQSKFNFWDPMLKGDLFYEVSTQKSARLQKVFVRVEQGTGNYKYLGDLNNNGIADENEFEPTTFDGDYIQVTIPTDQLFPVIDLKTSTRWKTNFSKISNERNFLSSVLKAISTETLWRIEENSKDTKYSNIYLLRLSTFQNEATTIRGSNLLQQDFFLFENEQDLSFRFRYLQRTNLNEFSGGFERGFFRERSLRIKFKMVEEISNQTDLVNSDDNLTSQKNSNRVRRVNSNFITSDFSYRPIRTIEVGFKLKVGRNEDTFPTQPTIIDLNGQAVRLNISFLGTGRLRIEIERNELLVNTNQNFIPFELTGGNQIGKNYFWRVNFDYKLSSNLQTTISYDGRLQGSSKPIHTMRAEARAYF
ncbi:Hypothetical protein IALB_1764 [Ignavibacterium album JCM 16511]|uniref:Uncharacterized protein n=1 Tax=Ignavibacterium album (strain DSM 19864 / JCM 16511 / NBRC 101810 / Mat9-16) TaxID=945713 RepID=I0AKG4_IGNAJ|nr:hypothetical protein [Ignavibacterium album]AFH49471.1 Hypothetical protein IALB_1764 [Ignavibacterium album JCM 16511]